jgi:hypothetical protein
MAFGVAQQWRRVEFAGHAARGAWGIRLMPRRRSKIDIENLLMHLRAGSAPVRG